MVFFLKSKLFKSNTGKKPKFLLYLENFPKENSGYQYRSSKWAEIFNESGLQCDVKTIVKNKEEFDNALHPECSRRMLRFWMWKRFKQCIYARKYNTVIVRRELLLYNDYGNLFMEKFLLKIHPNVILDFDDDIAASKGQPKQITNNFGKIMLEDGNKFNNSLRIYKRFIVGSKYLKELLLLENNKIEEENVLVIPTCVDYDYYPPKQYEREKNGIIFGWVGGNRNLRYLDMIIEPLNELYKTQKIKLIVVAGASYNNPRAKFEIENQQWSLDTEKEQIKKFDIGLMPIENELLDKGKCGFKLIQYMGMGVVSIATNVTINGEIITDGENGFLVKSDNSNWLEVLQKAASLQSEFERIGIAARKTINAGYTFEANKSYYLKFLARCAE